MKVDKTWEEDGEAKVTYLECDCGTKIIDTGDVLISDGDWITCLSCGAVYQFTWVGIDVKRIELIEYKDIRRWLKEEHE